MNLYTAGPIVAPGGPFTISNPPPIYPGGPIVAPGGPFTLGGGPIYTGGPIVAPGGPFTFGPSGVVPANGLPGQVAIISTAPSLFPVLSTALPTPTNVQTDPTASTVLTSGSLTGSLIGELEAIVSDPIDHLFGLAILLAIGWFIWKHR